MNAQLSPADLLDLPAFPAVASPGSGVSSIPSVLSVLSIVPSADLSAVRIEEAIHIDYCERRNRLLWESAAFTLQAVLVDHGHGERRYGPHDPWRESRPDPRGDYTRAGAHLIRRAVAGRDYDEVRHVTGLR